MIVGIIYQAKFPNGKRYIGQTSKKLQRRKKQHINNAKAQWNNQDKGKKIYSFYKAIRKYGEDNIEWTIIDTCSSREEMNEKEKFWIRFFKTYVGFKECYGYNETLGGDSQDKFTILNDEQLVEFGNDFRKGFTVDELQAKYKISNRRFVQNVFNGKAWQEYTKIPDRDYNIFPQTPITHKQVDEIIKRFKEVGKVDLISKELNISEHTIYRIVKGESWQNYTKISKDFFKNYNRRGVCNGLEIKEIIKLHKKGLNNKEISEKTGFSSILISNVVLGRTGSDITGMQYKNKKDRTPPNCVKLTKEQVLEIVDRKNNGEGATQISKNMKLPYPRVSSVYYGNSWSWLTGIKPNKKK